MRILAVKSVPLSEDTVAAWRSVNNSTDITVKFLLRDREPNEAIGIAERNSYDMILNLGNSELTYEDPMVWNSLQVCDMLRTPGGMRRSPLAAVLPPQMDWNEPNVWVKGPGRAGWNKHHYTTGLTDEALPITNQWDCQQHIEGQEYRVLTVGLRVVQSSRRYGTNETREYQWTGTANTPKPVKNICRYAASLLPNQRTVIGWDVIDAGDRVFIFEGNTSPGVNDATAERVCRELHRQVVKEDLKPVEETPQWQQNNINTNHQWHYYNGNFILTDT
jgi:hypothetical protein